MKKITSILFFSLLVWNISAQDFASNFIAKHGDKDLEVVSIGKSMLSAVANMSPNDPEMKDAIQGLEGIKIITTNSKECARKSFKNAYAMLTKKSEGFEEMMSVKESDEETYIMTRGENGVVKDFVLLTGSNNGFNMICLSGNINVAVLTKLASAIHLDKLKKIDTSKEQSKRQ